MAEKKRELRLHWSDVLGSRIAFHVAKDEWGIAQEIFFHARFNQAGENDLTLGSSIAELVSTRTANKLIDSGYHTIEDINGATDEELRSIKGLGGHIIAEIRTAIAETNLTP